MQEMNPVIYFSEDSEGKEQKLIGRMGTHKRAARERDSENWELMTEKREL